MRRHRAEIKVAGHGRIAKGVAVERILVVVLAAVVVAAAAAAITAATAAATAANGLEAVVVHGRRLQGLAK